ncbi:MAG: hypothetical protein WC359_14200 [Dehalococcoidia bacterium]|jgi:hypothetical protein
MRELIKAVEYNIKPILWYIGTILVCLLIGCAIGTFWLHDVLFPPMQVTDTTAAEWHGETVKPAIVAASKVPAGVIAQIELTMNFPAEHGWGEIIGTKPAGGGPSQKDSSNQQIGIADQPSGPSAVPIFQGPRKVRFAANGEYWADQWSVNVIIQQLTDGSYKVLTDEDGVSFTVKSAVAVKPKQAWIRTGLSAGYDGKGNLSAGGNLLLWNHVQVGGGYRTDNAWELKGGWLW